MSKQTNPEHGELLNTQTNANSENTSKENSPSKLIRHEPIPNTPFHLIIQDGMWFITFKNYKLTTTERLDEEPETDDDIHKIIRHAESILELNKWQIIMYMCGIIHETIAAEAVSSINKLGKNTEFKETQPTEK